MSKILKNTRLMMLSFGIAVAVPTALVVTAGRAEASGYILASGFWGQPLCIPAFGMDCPPDGIIWEY